MEKEKVPENVFEQWLLNELGTKDLKEVTTAIYNNVWAFKITPVELWKKINIYFAQPLTPEQITELLTGGKTPAQIREEIKNKQWPFTVSAQEMRKVVEKSGVNKPEN